MKSAEQAPDAGQKRGGGGDDMAGILTLLQSNPDAIAKLKALLSPQQNNPPRGNKGSCIS